MSPTSKPRPRLEEAPFSRRGTLPPPARGANDAPSSGSRPSATPPTSAFTSAMIQELSRYLSEMNSVAILSVAATSLGLQRDQLEPKHLSAILAQVQASFDFFGVSPERRDRCLGQLVAVAEAARSGAGDADDVTILVEKEDDIVHARNAGKELCRRLGFTEIGTTKVMTVISELSRNIYNYAGHGVIRVCRLSADRPGVQVIASDRGPGIPDVNRVMSPGFRSKTGMGRGLRGTRALMDSFDIQSRPGEGTVVTVRKEKC